MGSTVTLLCYGQSEVEANNEYIVRLGSGTEHHNCTEWDTRLMELITPTLEDFMEELELN